MKKESIVILQTGELFDISSDKLKLLLHRDFILLERMIDRRKNLFIQWNHDLKIWTMNKNKLNLFKYLNNLIDKNEQFTNSLLVDFLNEKNIYNKFVEYMIMFNYNNNKYDSLFTFCDEIKPHNYIFIAFSWIKTTEGYDYWSNINNDWIDYIN